MFKGKKKWLIIVLIVLMHLISFTVIALIAKNAKKNSDASTEASLPPAESRTLPETSVPAAGTTAGESSTAGVPLTEPVTEAPTQAPETVPPTEAPTTESFIPLEGPLAGGTYRVVTQDTGGPVVRIPIVDIDREEARFNLYTLTDRSTSKGAGSLSYADGVYTMHFDGSERTTDFTADENGLTFLSRLYFGIAAYNYTDEQGNFLPFEAEVFPLPPEVPQESFEAVELALPSGVYAVDISPIGIENVSSAPKDLRLAIDNTSDLFCLYEAADPSVLKNTGHVIPTEEGFALVYDKTGFVTPFTYADGVLSFTNYLYYGSSYLKNENYEFVPHTAALTAEEAPSMPAEQ